MAPSKPSAGALDRCLLLVRRARASLRAFGRASQGIAAVEFAMILPILVLLYLGMTEITYAVNTDRRILQLGRTLADLTGRQTDVTSTTMDGIFRAAFTVTQPYKLDDPARPLSMVVSSVVVKDTGQRTGNPPQPVLQAKVCWSEARQVVNGALQRVTSPLPAGTVVPVPVGFQTANSSFIRSDVNLDYRPLFGTTILRWITNNGTSSIHLGETTPWPIRNVPEVTMSGVPACRT